jgi:hypothetical protein
MEVRVILGGILELVHVVGIFFVRVAFAAVVGQVVLGITRLDDVSKLSRY